jgi:hypothetical protein
LDGKGISGFGWMKMKLCWMTKERDWVGWKLERIVLDGKVKKLDWMQMEKDWI